MTILNNGKVILGGFVCQVDVVDPYQEDFGAHHLEDVCLCPYCTHVRFILRHMENVEEGNVEGLLPAGCLQRRVLKGQQAERKIFPVLRALPRASKKSVDYLLLLT